jgi:hypothetical protein
VWKEGELVKGSVRAPDGSFFTSAFAKGQPSGPAAFCLANGATVEGLHPAVAANAGEDDADDENSARTLQWVGSSVVQADRTTRAKLEAKYLGGNDLPSRKKALIVAPDYTVGKAYPAVVRQPPEPAARRPALALAARPPSAPCASRRRRTCSRPRSSSRASSAATSASTTWPCSTARRRPRRP